MKKSLLLLATLGMSSAAFAQWNNPTVQSTPMVEGDTLYLFNVGAQGFLTGANDYGTRASVSSTQGNKVVIKAAFEDEAGTVPLGSYHIENLVNAGGKAGKMSSLDCQAFDGIWIDGDGRNGDGMWKFTSVADGSYTINNTNVTTGNFGIAEFFKGSANTRTFIYDGSLEYEFTNDQDESVTGPQFTGEFWDKWIFVTPAEYDKVIAQFKAVAAAKELRAEIDKYKAEYPAADYTSVESVYSNPSSTAEELTEAKAKVQQIVKDYLKDILLTATPTAPQDATSYITNPSFETGDLTGWTCSKTNTNGKGDSSDMKAADNGNGTYHCDNADGNYVFNIWSWGNPITQNVKDLPAGIYKLEAMVASSDDCTNVYITADGGYGEIHHAVELEMPKQTGGTRGSFLFPAKDSILIGAVGSDTDGKSYIAGGVWWYKADDFKLTFYGNSDASYQFWAKEYGKSLPSYDEDVAITTQLRADFEAAKNTFTQGATSEEILAAYETIKVLADSIPANEEAYKNLFAKIEAWETALSDKQDLSGEYWDAFADFINGETSENYPAITPVEIREGDYSMTTAEVEAYIAKVDELYSYAVAHSLSEGSDCTDMIINPAFTDASGNGWTFEKNDNVTATNPRGGLEQFYCAEAYGGWDSNAGFLFDVHQEINDVPDGLYSISVNCFYRPGDNGQFDGTEEVPAVIYMNDFQTPVQHIAKEAIADITDMESCGKLLSATSWVETEGIGFVPNSMDAASQAFALDMYKQTVYGLVQGGKMRIGIKKETKTDNNRNWCLWTNFKLTYEGKNAIAVKSVLTDLAVNMQTYVENNSDFINGYGKDLSDKAIDNAKNAVQTNNAEAMWEALISFNSDFTTLRALVATMQELATAQSALNDAVDTYGDTASQEALAKYNEVANADTDGMNLEELKALIEKTNMAAAMLKVPNTEGASDDNGINVTQVIINPTFDTEGDFTGWLGSSFGAGGTKSTCAERYNMNYDTYQDLAGLPAGTYKLTVAGFYRQGSIANDYLIATTPDTVGCYYAYLYAESEELTYQAPIMNISSGAVNGSEAPASGAEVKEGSGIVVPNTMADFTTWKGAGYYLPTEKYNTVIFKVGESGKARIGVKKEKKLDTDWSIFDDFTLTYYGADSKLETGIEAAGVETEGETIITTLSGVRVKSLVKGINIVKIGNKTIKVNVK